jgi:hypothetical protein
MDPVRLEIVVPPIMGAGVGCGTCRAFMEQAGLPVKEGQEGYPAELVQMARRLGEWVERMRVQYPEGLRVELVDGLSPLGIWKQIRHGLRPLPGFVLDGKRALAGWDLERVEALIRERMVELGMACQGAPSPS